MSYLYPFDEVNPVVNIKSLVGSLPVGTVVKRCVYTGGGGTLTIYDANEKAPVDDEGLDDGREVIVVTPVG